MASLVLELSGLPHIFGNLSGCNASRQHYNDYRHSYKLMYRNQFLGDLNLLLLNLLKMGALKQLLTSYWHVLLSFHPFHNISHIFKCVLATFLFHFLNCFEFFILILLLHISRYLSFVWRSHFTFYIYSLVFEIRLKGNFFYV